MKVAKVAARVPFALVSAGDSEIVYHCARGLVAPPVLPAVDAWADLTSELRLSRCWEQIQANRVAANSGSSGFSSWNQQPLLWDQSKDARHHRKGHKHHHRHGC